MADDTQTPADTQTAPAEAGVLDKYAPYFAAAQKEYGVPADLLKSIAMTESSGVPDAEGPPTQYGDDKGVSAQGLMQFMPKTADELGIDPLDPGQAIMGAAYKLRVDAQTRYKGDLAMAVAAYHGGYDKANWGKDTLGYVQNVFGDKDYSIEGSLQPAPTVDYHKAPASDAAVPTPSLTDQIGDFLKNNDYGSDLDSLGGENTTQPVTHSVVDQPGLLSSKIATPALNIGKNGLPDFIADRTGDILAQDAYNKAAAQQFGAPPASAQPADPLAQFNKDVNAPLPQDISKPDMAQDIASGIEQDNGANEKPMQDNSMGATVADLAHVIPSEAHRLGLSAEDLAVSLGGGLNVLNDDWATKIIKENMDAKEALNKDQAKTTGGEVVQSLLHMAPAIAVSFIPGVGEILGPAAFAAQGTWDSGTSAIDQGYSLANAQLKGIGSGLLNTALGGVAIGKGNQLLSRIPAVGGLFAQGAADTVAGIASRSVQGAATMAMFEPLGTGIEQGSDLITGEKGDSNASYIPTVADLLTGALMVVPHSAAEFASRNSMPATPTMFADGTVGLAHKSGALFSTEDTAQSFIDANKLDGATIDPVNHDGKNIGFVVKRPVDHIAQALNDAVEGVDRTPPAPSSSDLLDAAKAQQADMQNQQSTAPADIADSIGDDNSGVDQDIAKMQESVDTSGKVSGGLLNSLKEFDTQNRIKAPTQQLTEQHAALSEPEADQTKQSSAEAANKLPQQEQVNGTETAQAKQSSAEPAQAAGSAQEVKAEQVQPANRASAAMADRITPPVAGVQAQESERDGGVAPRAYSQKMAELNAKMLKRQGFGESDIIPHPTEPGMFAVVPKGEGKNYAQRPTESKPQAQARDEPPHADNGAVGAAVPSAVRPKAGSSAEAVSKNALSRDAHPSTLESASDRHEPLNAEAVEDQGKSWGLDLPDGYIKKGDQYVYERTETSSENAGNVKPSNFKDLESWKNSLSPDQLKEVNEYEDLRYKTVAMQGPEQGYKPYKLTGNQKERLAELDGKYRQFYVRQNPEAITPDTANVRQGHLTADEVAEAHGVSLPAGEAQADGAGNGAQARVAETPDEVFAYLKKTEGGVVHGGKILYPKIKVIGMPGTFQWRNGKVEKLGDIGGVGTVKDASKSEADDVIDALEKDQAQIVLQNQWGGSGRDTSSKTVAVLHNPKGMAYKSRDEWLAKKPAPSAESALSSIKQSDIPAAEQIRLAEDLKKGNITPESVHSILGTTNEASSSGTAEAESKASFPSEQEVAENIGRDAAAPQSKEPDFKKLALDNKLTVPKIPTGNIFQNPIGELGNNYRFAADKAFESGDTKIETVNLSDIIPTQKTVNIDNLKAVRGVNIPPNLVKVGAKYYVTDGHNRIGLANISGKQSIDANVYDATPKPSQEPKSEQASGEGAPLLSRGEPTDNPHTPDSLRTALLDAHNQTDRSALQSMLDKGQAKVITSDEAAKIIGDDAQAFYDPATKTTHFIADHISQDASPADLRGLVRHEIAVHALELGKSSPEFKSILDQVEIMRHLGQKDVVDAYNRVPSDTRPEDVNNETLAYLVQHSPDLGVVKKFIGWFREQLRSLGWKPPLSVNDLRYMAQSALSKSFPEQSYADALKQAGAIEDEYRQPRTGTEYERALNEAGIPVYSKSHERFYSRLRVALRDAPDKIFTTGKQAALWLQGNAAKLGVKADELHFSGVLDYLNLQGKITKQDVLDHLDNFSVKVETKMLRGEQSLPASEVRRMIADGARIDVFDGERRIDYDTVDMLDDDYHLNVVDDGGKGSANTKYGQYVVPNGTDYKEMLLTLPTKQSKLDAINDRYDALLNGRPISELNQSERLKLEQITKEHDDIADNDNSFQSSHFPDKDILAHTRFDTFTRPDGGKTLRVQELQSDWNTAGRKEGFSDPAKREAIEKEIRALGISKPLENLTVNDLAKSGASKELQDRFYDNIQSKGNVPTAPFVGDTKSYVALLMKHIISHAIDTNHDRVVIINGEQAGDLYDLSKQVDSVTINRHTEDGGGYQVSADKDGRQVIPMQDVKTLSELEGIVGKDLAQKAEAMHPTEEKTFSGLDLKMGAAGMKGFYDGIVKQVGNDVLKRLGGDKIHTVDSAEVGMDKSNKGMKYQDQSNMEFDITPAMRAKVQGEGIPLFSRTKAIDDLNAEVLKRDGIDGAFQLSKLDDPKLGEVFKKTFGVDIVPIATKNPAARDFLAMQFNGRMYVNADNGRHGFVQLAGHELLHQIRKERPGLYDWFNEQAENYLSSGAVERYAEGLRATGADMGRTDAREEMLADFVGDSLSDRDFLNHLSDNNPSKFKQFVSTVKNWLGNVRDKLSRNGFGSSQYFTDVKGLQGYLSGLLDAYKSDGSIPEYDNVQYAKSRLATQDEVDKAEALKQAGSLGKSLKSASDFLKEGFSKLAENYKSHLHVADTDIDKVIGNITGNEQVVDFELAKIADEWTSKFSKQELKAMSRYVNVGGDMDVLKRQSNTVPKLHKKPFDDAQNLSPEAKAICDYITKQNEELGVAAVAHGVLHDTVENYVRGEWERVSPEGQVLMAQANSGILDTHPREAMKKVFATTYDGIMLGAIPKNDNIAYQFVASQRAVRRAIAAKQGMKDLLVAKEHDGKPVTAVGGVGSAVEEKLDANGKKIADAAVMVTPNVPPNGAVTEDGRAYLPYDHPALRGWKWVTKDTDGKSVLMQGNMWVHPDSIKRLDAVLGRSKVKDYEAGKGIPFIGGKRVLAGAMNAGAYVKSTILTGLPVAPFHQVALGLHSTFYGVNPFNLPKIDFKARPLLVEMVNHGLMLYNHNAMHEFGEGLTGGGLFGAIPFSKHFTKDGESLPWPVISAWQQRYGAYLFQDVIPRYKAAQAEKTFERDLKTYSKELASGEMTRDQLLFNAAARANAGFGELNYKYMGRNKTQQDIIRLLSFAPDFLEARARSLVLAAMPGGHEQRKAFIVGAAIMAGVAQMINQMFGDEDRPDWYKAPFSVFIGGRQYTPRSEVGDLAHLITDPTSFFSNRVNPLFVRMPYELATQRDSFGQKLSVEDTFKDVLKSWMPIQAQGLFQDHHGQTRTQAIAGALLQSVGISNKQAKTDAEKMISDIQSEKYKNHIKLPNEQKRMEGYMNLKDAYQTGELNSMDDVRAQAKAQGLIISKGQLKAIQETRDQTPIAKEKQLEAKMRDFSPEQLLQVYGEMDDAEKAMTHQFMISRINRSHLLSNDEKQAARNRLN